MSHPHSNRLTHEKSPYLLQHAHNPVDWYPWGEEAFKKAKEEDKPIFLSIGYSTCHWCHVMERESFENKNIADILNKYFVAIKVDREERPDIDHIYMSVVTAMTGSGGWPLSVFLTPQQEPFYGGAYFPPEAKWGAPGFTDLLLSLHEAWQNRKEQVLKSSTSITEALSGQLTSRKGDVFVLDEQIFKATFEQLEKNFDPEFGGFGNSPKFPMGHSLSFLLRYFDRSNDPEALQVVTKTLIQMHKGGMYDYLGGGFHRYSTDREWQVPHFEKMLYDQAILSKAYLEAYQVTKNKEYADIAREIFDYVLRDMQNTSGGFFSAEDADSVGLEGAFYIWGEKEIREVLSKEEGDIFTYCFNIRSGGNVDYDPHGEFTGQNILYVRNDGEETAKHFKKTPREVEGILRRAREKLFQARLKRPRPHLDDKILVDWNGLMISSLAFGSRVLEEPRYREAAQRGARFILKNIVNEEGRLLHRFRDGQAAILANINDYAFFVHGLIDLYEAGFDIEYLKEARRLAEEMVRLFWDEKFGGFFLTSADGEQLIWRPKEIYDGALPSGNSIAALDLIRLNRFFMGNDWEKKARHLFSSISQEMTSQPTSYTQMLIALDFAVGPSKEIIMAAEEKSKDMAAMLKSVYTRFIPNKIVLWRPVDEKKAQEIIRMIPFIAGQKAVSGRATAYVCCNHTCQFPVADIKKFEEMLDEK